jgi:hypothetical protein
MATNPGCTTPLGSQLGAPLQGVWANVSPGDTVSKDCEPRHMLWIAPRFGRTSWLTHLTSLSLEDVFRPPMVSVKLPKSVVSGFSSL